jgi:hypothetical protein
MHRKSLKKNVLLPEETLGRPKKNKEPRAPPIPKKCKNNKKKTRDNKERKTHKTRAPVNR